MNSAWDAYRQCADRNFHLADDPCNNVFSADVSPTLEAIDKALHSGGHKNLYFINETNLLVRYADKKLWVSGHTHSPFDNMADQSKVLGSPKGCPFIPEKQTYLFRHRKSPQLVG